MSEDNKTLDLETVKGFFEQNKDSEEVVGLVKQFIKPELVESFLDSEDGKKILQPKLDKHFTKGLETWKQNNLQTMIEGEINKKFPPETEEQKQLRSLQQKLESIEKEKSMATIKAEAIQELTSKGLPVGVADYFVTDNLEATRDRINSFAQEFQKAVTTEVNKRLGENGGTPKTNNNSGKFDKVTKEQLMGMSYSERTAFYNENPEEYARIMKG